MILKEYFLQAKLCVIFKFRCENVGIVEFIYKIVPVLNVKEEDED